MKSGKTQNFLLIFLAIILLNTVSVFAENGWISMRSENFTLAGNAPAKDIESVAVKLEQFRLVIQKVFPDLKINSQIPTKVLIFKDEESFSKFKPLDENGKPSDWVAGYFQAGEFVNHITFAFGSNQEKAYRIIFHEYAHFLVSNNYKNIPTWFNEGFAEYLEQFNVKNKRTFRIGEADSAHLETLRNNRLFSAKEFFAVNNNSLRKMNRRQVSIFYAQAWAMMHFIMHKNGAAGIRQKDEFIKLINRGFDHDKAFTEAFKTIPEDMQRELTGYILSKKFDYADVKIEKDAKFDGNFEQSHISEQEVTANLAELLFNQQRFDESEIYLNEAVSKNAFSPEANLLTALLKIKRGKYAEAKPFLENAVKSGKPNYIAFYNYALVLIREKLSVNGYLSRFEKEEAAKIKFYLQKAIESNPNFADSYNLFGLICTVNNEEIDKAIEMMKTAIKISPEKEWYPMRVADLYIRKKDFANARNFAQKIVLQTTDKYLKKYAADTLTMINNSEQMQKTLFNSERRSNAYIQSDEPISDEEFARIKELLTIQGINEALRKPVENEKRILGKIISIECKNDQVFFSVTAQNLKLKFRNADFQNLRLRAFAENTINTKIGCELNPPDKLSNIIYKPFESGESEISGEITAIEFVPDNFKYAEDND